MRACGIDERKATAALLLTLCVGCGETALGAEQGQASDPLGSTTTDAGTETSSGEAEGAPVDGSSHVTSVPVAAPSEAGSSPRPPGTPMDYCGRGFIEDDLANVTDLVDCGLIPSDADPGGDVVIAARQCVLSALTNGQPFKLYDDRFNEVLRGRTAYYWDVARQRPVQVAIQTSGGCGQSEVIVCERLVEIAACAGSTDQLCLECQGIVHGGVCCALCAE